MKWNLSRSAERFGYTNSWSSYVNKQNQLKKFISKTHYKKLKAQSQRENLKRRSFKNLEGRILKEGNLQGNCLTSIRGFLNRDLTGQERVRWYIQTSKTKTAIQEYFAQKIHPSEMKAT